MRFEGKNHKQFNYIDEQYDFRFNVVTSFYEWRLNRKKKWRQYDDRDKKNMLIELMQRDLELPDGKFDTFIESTNVSKDFNPFKKYFEQLPKHKGKYKYIKELAKTVTTDNPKHFNKVLERFLVGTIDCLLKTDSVNDVCLVFQGKQGLGKTRWMRRLLPKKFQKEYLYEGAIDTKDKDHVIYLSQYWFIHLDELESLRSNDMAAVKSFITRSRISVRKSYGRHKTNFVRRASFLGSVNEDKFLSDITGNRRWLVFKVLFMDYMHKIDPDKFWAEAYSLWKNKNYRYWFDAAEIKEINEYNEEFRTVSLEEELLVKNFNFNNENGKGEYMASSDVVIKIGTAMPSIMSKLHNILMGKALSKHAVARRTEKGFTKYYLEYTGIDVETQADIFNAKSKGVFTNKKTTDLSINEDDDLPF